MIGQPTGLSSKRKIHHCHKTTNSSIADNSINYYKVRGTLPLLAEFAAREGKLLTACRRAETQASVRYTSLLSLFSSLSLHFVQLTEQLAIMLAGM